MASLKKPLEDVVKKILDTASVTGNVSQEQLILILLYIQECKKEESPIKDVIGNGQAIINFLEGMLK